MERESQSTRSLFEAVGKEFGVGGTVASELYYEIRKIDEAFWASLTRNRKTSGKNKKTRKLPKKLKNIRE